MDVSNDDRIIISGSDDNSIRLWTWIDEQITSKIIAEHDNAVSSVAISKKSEFVVSGDGSGCIKVTYLNDVAKNIKIQQLSLNIFNSDLSHISNDSDVSNDFLQVLYQNGCHI